MLFNQFALSVFSGKGERGTEKAGRRWQWLELDVESESGLQLDVESESGFKESESGLKLEKGTFVSYFSFVSLTAGFWKYQCSCFLLFVSLRKRITCKAQAKKFLNLFQKG